MSGLTADLAGLDGCGRTMLREAGRFGSIADLFSARAVDSSMFGAMPVSGQLAEISGRVNAAAGIQFSAAETFLRGVERGLDNVREGVTETERANVRVIRRAV